ncbi:MAG TPA: histidinol-phosphatase HisJ family protein [Chloroflexi bacterium]|nr:histidinol-phosphatase HisJ family protein [Chloroflexota bacterium]
MTARLINSLNGLADYHVHTRFSMDSEADLVAICEAAVAKGLDEIAFTDHVDFGPVDPPTSFLPSTGYLTTIETCRARWGTRLTIRAGAEIGEPHLFPEKAARILSHGDFDFFIGSAHYGVSLDPSSGIEGLQPTWHSTYFEQPLDQAYEAYFQQILALAKTGDFDVLGHVDLIKRDAREFGHPYDGPEPYADLIRAALRAVVERGKGIEINTSPLARGQPEPCPSLDILRWYRELGGEILTLGSDAHRPEAVGTYFDVALEMARAAGFTRLARFERRQIKWTEI